jgi:hypothetical protein
MKVKKKGQNRILLYVTSIFIIINLSNCNLDTPVSGKKLYGEGPLVTHYVDADSFKIFQHIGVGSVLIETGDSLEIFMRAQQNIIDEMAFAFGDDKFAWGFSEEVEIIEADSILLTIRMPNAIEGIFVSGVGYITIVGEQQESLYVNVNGYAEFEAWDLEVDVCELNISGLAKCRFWVNEEIIGSITGSGEVWYKGNPEINVQLYGDGKFWDAN